MFGEAVLTNCEKCNETQKEMLKKVIKWYANYKPDLLLEKLVKAGKDIKQRNANQ